MQIIPISPVANQSLRTTTGAGQFVDLTIRQVSTGTFADIAVNGSVILTGVLCRDRVRLVRDAYLGMTGDLIFADQEGASDPDWAGLGSRWLLYWLDTPDTAGVM